MRNLSAAIVAATARKGCSAAIALALLSGGFVGCTSHQPIDGPNPQLTMAPPPPEGSALDARRIVADAKKYVATEQICDLEHVGQLEDVEPRVAQRYPIPIAKRRLVRCAAPAGGWADLVFRKEAQSLAAFIATGQRLRIKVVSADGGFEGYPVLEFVATIGDGTAAPHALEAVPEAGDDFTSHAGASTAGLERICAAAAIGHFERITRTRDAYPKHARYHMAIACRHVTGVSWVDAVFGPNEVERALSLRRLEKHAWIVYRESGGIGDYPVVLPAAAKGPAGGTAAKPAQPPATH